MEGARLVCLRPDDLTWDRAVRLFELRSRSQNFSPTTQTHYKVHLGYWRDWLGVNGGLQPPQVTTEVLRGYLASMKARGCKDAYVDSAFRILKCFWRFLEREGLLLVNPMTRVERPRREKRMVRPFSEEQVRLLLAAIDTHDPLGVRDYALILMLCDTGLRISEALAVKISDIDLGQRTITVTNAKGRKERLVAFGRSTLRAIMNWLKTRGDIPGVEILWVNRFGGPLTRRTAEDILKEHGTRAGIQGVRISPHTLRHTFATCFLRNGGDIFALQKLLGHANLEMVRHYAQVSDTDTQAKHRLASPIDRLGPLPNERKQVRLRS